MTYAKIYLAIILSSFMLVSCDLLEKDEETPDETVASVIDQSELNQIMLIASDPNDSIRFFTSALEKDPNRLDLKRGLAASQLRAGHATLAAATYKDIIASGRGSSEDRLGFVEALIRTNDWQGASDALEEVSESVDTFQRHRLAALIADSKENWEEADKSYALAASLTERPAMIYNNWGYSKLTRRDFAEAEELFIRAIQSDPTLFTAKNNLALARAAQNNFNLPVVPMTEDERAKIYYTLGLAALKTGDLLTGQRLLEAALDTSPTYFPEAKRSLDALLGQGT